MHRSDDRPVFGEVGSTHPWEPFVSHAPPLKLHTENVLNRQQINGELLDFAHILYEV